MKQNIKRASVITLLAISLGAATTPSIASAATLNNQQDVTATNQQQFNKELEQKTTMLISKIIVKFNTMQKTTKQQ